LGEGKKEENLKLIDAVKLEEHVSERRRENAIFPSFAPGGPKPEKKPRSGTLQDKT